jgi:hypothetical protein
LNCEASTVTDTHEDVARLTALMKPVDWTSTDFFVHLGDAFDWVDSETQPSTGGSSPTHSA